MSRELRASYVLDAAGVGRGVKQADRELLGLEESASRTGRQLDETMGRYGSGLAKSAKDVSLFDERTSKMGGHLRSLGQSMGNWGIPFGKSLEKIGDDLDRAKSKAGSYGQVLADVGKVATGALAGGFAVAAAESLHLAGNFQQATDTLVTSAGESRSQLGVIRKGILDLSVATDTSTSQLTAGLYHISSAGITGAKGLDVLRAASEGAKAEGADLDTVAKSLAGTMVSLHEPASQATNVMNEMLATVSSGDMRMQDLASSLGNVVPAASKAGLSFAQVGGAMATMTSQNMSAQQAAQDLRHTILALESPSNVASKEMAQFGINSNQVADRLGKEGLTGTLQHLSETILQHMGPSGDVLLKTFNASKTAGADATTMFDHLSPAAQKLAKSYMDGTIGIKALRSGLQSLGGVQGSQLQEWEKSYQASKSFNDQLKAGVPGSQTYSAALAKMMGGTTGYNTAVMLTGKSMSEFQGNVARISDAARKGGANVDNWSLITHQFNFQIGQAGKEVTKLGIELGTALIPKVEAGIKVTEDIVGWFTKHKAAAEALAGVIGGALAVVMGAFAVNVGKSVVTSVMDAGEAIGTLVSKMRGLSTEGAVSSEGTAAAAEEMSAGYKAALAQVEAISDEAASQVGASMEEMSAAVTEQASVAAEALGSLDAALGELGATAPEAFGAVDAGMATVAESAPEVGEAVDVGLGPIGLILGGITVAATLLSGHWHQIWDGIKTVATDAGHFITGALGDIERFAKKWGPDLLAVFLPVIGIPLLIEQHWSEIAGFFTKAFTAATQAVTGGVTDVIGVVSQIPSDILQALGDATSWLRHIGQDAITGLVDGAKAYLHLLQVQYVEIPEKILGWLGDAGHWLVGLGGDAIRGLAAGGTDALHLLEDEYVKIPLEIIGWLGDAASWLLATGSNAIHGLAAGVDAAQSWLASEVGKIPGWITSAVSGAASWLYSAGQEVVEGLINGIGSLAGTLMHKVESLGSGVVGVAKSVFHIGSPSKVMHEIGVNVTQGLINGIEEHAGQLDLTSATVAKSAVASFTRYLSARLPALDNLFGGKALTAQINNYVEQLDRLASKTVVAPLTGKTTPAEQRAELAKLAKAAETSSGSVASAIDRIISTLTGHLKTMSTQGKQAIAYLGEGLAKGGSSLETYTADAVRLIDKDFAGSSLDASVDKMYRKFENLAKGAGQSLKTIGSELTKAQANLKTAQAALTAAENQAASTTSTLEGQASIIPSTGTGPADASGTATITAGDILSNLQQTASSYQAYDQVLADLKTKGLSAELISQLAQAGPAAGLATAQQLDRSATLLAQANSAQTTIDAASTDIGTLSTATLTGAQLGVTTAQGIVTGLQGEESSVTAELTSMMTKMEKTIQGATEGGHKGDGKTKARDHGKAIMEAYATGITQNTHRPLEAARKLSKDLAAVPLIVGGHGRRISVAAGGHNSIDARQSLTQHITFELHVNGTLVGTMADLADKLAPPIREKLIQISRQSGKSGLTL